MKFEKNILLDTQVHKSRSEKTHFRSMVQVLNILIQLILLLFLFCQ